ncbi:MAG: hypothetical protein COA43_03930 [Robiginitomaculum sp.]|nr:MAG: hypothetical protein COA43_03930 [Robiginitomaculum sp.]
MFLIETEKPTTVFGRRFVFDGMYIERMARDTPLTQTIKQYLPWVDPKHVHWEGAVWNTLNHTSDNNKLRSEMTLAEKISRHAFVSANRRF